MEKISFGELHKLAQKTDEQLSFFIKNPPKEFRFPPHPLLPNLSFPNQSKKIKNNFKEVNSCQHLNSFELPPYKVEYQIEQSKSQVFDNSWMENSYEIQEDTSNPDYLVDPEISQLWSSFSHRTQIESLGIALSEKSDMDGKEELDEIDKELNEIDEEFGLKEIPDIYFPFDLSCSAISVINDKKAIELANYI